MSAAERDAPRRRSWLRGTLRGALGAALLVGAAWGWRTLADAEALRIRTVLVVGAGPQVAPAEVLAAARGHAVGGFLRVDLDALRADVEALPWVASATVRREWPGTLRIVVREEAPVATWRGAELLNADGQRFAPLVGAPDPALPALAGPEGTERAVLEAAQQMQRVLGAWPAKVELSERRAWEAVLADGTRVVLGRREPLQRLARFAAVAAPLVAPEASHVAYVDMRYANGFAVGWRTPRPQPVREAPRRRERTDV
jgi:cell division protein FtsQ